jgi:AraC family transcriptional regulator, positive regulator of tynA and feaB
MQLAAQTPCQVATGEYCLLDHGQPYELQHGDGVRVLCLDLPRATLDAVLARPAAAVGRVMRADSGLSRLLAVLLRELGGEIAPETPAHFVPALAQGLLGFVAAAYSDGADEPLPAAEARQRALLALIDARLHDADLNPADVAREAGVSPRRLRALLAAGGEPFSAYVLRRRLERCAVLLRDAHWRGCSITEIAFRAGFNNATHFGYAFKRRYGKTPREFRASP